MGDGINDIGECEQQLKDLEQDEGRVLANFHVHFPDIGVGVQEGAINAPIVYTLTTADFDNLSSVTQQPIVHIESLVHGGGGGQSI